MLFDSGACLRSTAEPLECCEFPSLHRRIGIRVGETMHHKGLDAEAVELDFERVSLNTLTAGGWTLCSEAEDKYVSMHKHVIDHLTTVIDELTAHRDRLRKVIED